MKDTTARRSTSLAVFGVSLLCAATANAGLKDTPPKTFDAVSTGTWQIDPARSDDARALLDKAREKMAASHGGTGGMDRGGFGGGGGGMSGGRRGGGGGRGGPGGSPPGGMSPGGPQDGQAGRGGGSNKLLDDLAINPPTLTVERTGQRVKVHLEEQLSACTAGAVVALSDTLGSGEMRCGWSGAAWVVETTRGNSFTRTDRYEPAADGKTLTYLTTVIGGRMPAIRISRTYVRTPG